MKHLLFFLLGALLLAGLHTADGLEGPTGSCEVHHVAMFKRSVPYAHGMIPMSKVEAEQGEWKRRMDHYPHPGDCEPATNIVLPGQEGQAVVDVCPKCEAALKASKR